MALIPKVCPKIMMHHCILNLKKKEKKMYENFLPIILYTISNQKCFLFGY